jgi:hypothetical protein
MLEAKADSRATPMGGSSVQPETRVTRAKK